MSWHSLENKLAICEFHLLSGFLLASSPTLRSSREPQQRQHHPQTELCIREFTSCSAFAVSIKAAATSALTPAAAAQAVSAPLPLQAVLPPKLLVRPPSEMLSQLPRSTLTLSPRPSPNCFRCFKWGFDDSLYLLISPQISTAIPRLQCEEDSAESLANSRAPTHSHHRA